MTTETTLNATHCPACRRKYGPMGAGAHMCAKLRAQRNAERKARNRAHLRLVPTTLAEAKP